MKATRHRVAQRTSLIVLLVLVVILGLYYFDRTGITDPTASIAQKVTLDELKHVAEPLEGKKILVEGKVLIDSICPPASEEENTATGPCVTRLYLVNADATEVNSAHEKIPLFADGRWISCTEPSGFPTCQAFRNDKHYSVTGVLKYMVAGGKRTNILVLDVESQQQL